MKNVLIVEDSRDISDWLKISLELEGYNCVVVNNNFQQLLDPNFYKDVDIIILDVWLRPTIPYEVDTNIVQNDEEHLVSMQIIQIIRKLPRHIRIIIFSAITDIAKLAEYVDAVIIKPANIKEIVRRMEER